MLRRLTAVTAVVAAVVTAGAWAVLTGGGRAWAGAVPAGARVEIRDFAFSPPALTVPAGATVTWTNLDAAPHTVTGTSGPRPFSSPQLSRGQSWSFTFTVPGSYGYYCAVHPTMTASVVVDRVAAPSQAPTSSGSPAPSPSIAPAASSPRPSPAIGPSVAAAPVAPDAAGTRVAPPGTSDAPTALAAPKTSAGAPASPSSRTLLVLTGLVVFVAAAGTLMVGGRTG